ncbi:MAG TPA: VWA domain-containing protein, partial [Vicinamibacteria bacterium]|nr:VWA domain-containing protein [Vicinamibacteria bacterium]
MRAAGRPEPPSSPAVPGPGTPAAPVEAPTPSQANLVVLVFDTLPVATAPFARQGALDLLSKTFPANTWFAVYKIDRGMRPLQLFTADQTRLASAVDFATAGDDARRRGPAAAALQSLSDSPAPTAAAPPPGRPDLPPEPALGGIGTAVEANLAELATRGQTFDSLYGLLAIARSLQPVRGRKSIVYFAEAREVPDSVTVLYDTTISEANRANVTIHTVDVRGLSPLRPGDRTAFGEKLAGFSAASGTRDPGQDGFTVRPPTASLPATADVEAPDTGGGPIVTRGLVDNPLWGSFLEHVARDTGGLAIADTNDLGRNLTRVVEELGLYYEVVYVPPNPVPDGRFRRIEAKVTRPGVRVRTRSGYFATPAAAPGLLAYELPLLAALGATAPAHDFAHDAGVLHFGATGREREALFLARVPLSGVRLIPDEARGAYRGRLALLGLVKDEAGRPVARLSQEWPIEGPLADRDRVRRTSAVFRRALTLPPGRYTLETAVQDRETGALSVRTKFVVAEAPPGSLALGSLSIVRSAEAASAPGAEGPLRVAGVSVQPEVGRPARPASAPEVSVILPIYPSLAGAGVGLRVELLRGGQPVAQARPALPEREPDGRIVWIGGLPTKRLTPGPYEIVVTARQGDESAEERTEFEIVAPAPVAALVSAPPPAPPDLVPVLDRAARYVLDYEQAFHDIAAEEDYTQWSEPQPLLGRQPVEGAGLT